MVNSSLTPRRVVTAAGVTLIVCLSGCSTPAASTSKAKAAPVSQSDVVIDENSSAPSALAVYERRVQEYGASREARGSHVRRILYADALLHLNEPRKAIVELVETEMIFPDAYLNALYLGLAYELAGDLKSARYWISQGIERNVDARSGSEWLHLAMVEARLELSKDPNWLKTHSVLQNNTHRTAEEILGAIKIQLAVRGDFGLRPDAVVCDLYFEAGICASSFTARQDYFAQSLELGGLRRSEIERHEKIRARAHASVHMN